MEDLKLFYNELIRGKSSQDGMPEFESLQSDQLLEMKRSFGFANYRLQKALSIMLTVVSESVCVYLNIKTNKNSTK